MRLFRNGHQHCYSISLHHLSKTSPQKRYLRDGFCDPHKMASGTQCCKMLKQPHHVGHRRPTSTNIWGPAYGVCLQHPWICLAQTSLSESFTAVFTAVQACVRHPYHVAHFAIACMPTFTNVQFAMCSNVCDDRPHGACCGITQQTMFVVLCIHSQMLTCCMRNILHQDKTCHNMHHGVRHVLVKVVLMQQVAFSLSIHNTKKGISLIAVGPLNLCFRNQNT